MPFWCSYFEQVTENVVPLSTPSASLGEFVSASLQFSQITGRGFQMCWPKAFSNDSSLPQKKMLK